MAEGIFAVRIGLAPLQKVRSDQPAKTGCSRGVLSIITVRRWTTFFRNAHSQRMHLSVSRECWVGKIAREQTSAVMFRTRSAHSS